MVAILSVISILISHLLVKSINYHLRRRESLRVARLFDKRHFKKEVFRQLRSYFSKQTSKLNFVTMLLVLTLLSLIQTINIKTYMLGTVNTEPMTIYGIYVLALFGVSIQKPNNDGSSFRWLSINQLFFLIFYGSLVFLVPSMIQASISSFRPALLTIWAFISLSGIYMLLVYLDEVNSFRYNKLVRNSFLFVTTMCILSFLIKEQGPSPLLGLMIFLITTLFCAAILSLRMNMVLIKPNHLLLRAISYYLVPVTTTVVLIFIGAWL